MRKCLQLFCFSLLGLYGLGAGIQAQDAVKPAKAAFGDETLIPAAFGIWTDRTGSSWSVEANGNIGRIGSTMVNSGLALLVDEEKFTSYQPMMTEDGKEFVLQGLPLDPLPGLQVQRRIRLLEEPGGLRYAELFHNGSADPITLSIGLATNFSGNFKTFLSDRGRSEPLRLAPAETGLVVLPGTSQSSRAFLFTLSDAENGTKPTISSQNRYGLTFRYRLDLAPGETGVIVHHVAQVVIPQNFDRRTLLQLGRPFALERIREAILPDWRPFVVNAVPLPRFSARSVMEAGGIASLGIAPGAKDTLAVGESTRLAGTTEGGPLKLVSPYGEAEFALDRIAAISGGKGRGDGRIRLFLRDGQIFSGQVGGGGLGFLPIQGSRLDLDPGALDRLVMAGGKTATGWPADTTALIETYDGDRIRATGANAVSFSLATAWGVLPISLNELAWLRPLPGDVPGYRVDFKDGTSSVGYIENETLTLSGTEIGEVSMPATRLRHIVTEAGWLRGEGETITPVGTVLRLPGDQTLVGAISNTTLPVLSEGITLEVALAEVRRVDRLDLASGRTDDSPGFRIERWDGGVITGRLPLDFLSVEVAGRTWQIPLRDIHGIELASQSLAPEILTKIEKLIGNLASPDWVTRESATRELGAFGYLARPVLQRELGTVTDPEVERRLERVLSGLN